MTTTHEAYIARMIEIASQLIEVDHCPDCDRMIGKCSALMIGSKMIIACEGYQLFDHDGNLRNL